MSKMKTYFGGAAAAAILGGMSGATLANGFGDSDASYWLNGGSHRSPAVIEFTPKTQPGYTCIYVQSSTTGGTLSCVRKMPELTPAK